MRESDINGVSANQGTGSLHVSFKLRFLLFLLPPVILLSGLMAVLITGMARNIIISNEKTYFERVFQKCSDGLRRKIFNRDIAGAESLLKTTAENNDLNSVVLIDPDQQVVISINSPISKEEAEISSHSLQMVLLGPQNNTEIWQLELSTKTGLVAKLVDMFLLFQIIVISVMTLGVVTGVFLVFDHLLLDPMRKITKASRSASNNEDFEPIPYVHDDEIGEMIKEFNEFIVSWKQSKEHFHFCLEKSDTLLFKMDISLTNLLFHGQFIPGTSIETCNIKTTEDFCNILLPDHRAEYKQAQFDLKEKMNCLDSGTFTNEFIAHRSLDETQEMEQVWLRIDICWKKSGSQVLCGGVIRNISAEKEREETLRRSEERFRLGHESIPVGIWKTRGESFIYMNKVMAEILGYKTPSEAISKIRSITHEVYLRPEDRTFFYDEMKKKGEVKNLELKFKKADGKPFWGALFGKIHRDHDGFYAEGGFMDITSRKESEEKLRENEEDYRLALEAAGVISYRLNISDNKIIFKGPSAEILGIEGQKFVPLKEFQKIIYPDDFQSFPPLYDPNRKKIQVGLNSHYVEDIRICRNNKDGELETRWIRLFFNYFHFSSHNRPSQQRGVIIDYTEQKNQEEALIESKNFAENASLKKSEFFADMSHEIRTPLNAIIGFSELLFPALKDGPHSAYISSIQTASRNLLNVINDILDLSKLESGKIEILSEPVSIEVISREIQAMFQTEAAKKNLLLEVIVDDSVPSILLLDEIRIKQVLNNLVWNAIKFTDTGKISIAFSAVPAKHKGQTDLIISVEDTGIGIAHSDKEEIFKPFFQKKGQGGKKGGTGLGLAICKRLIEVMNGEISLKTELGKGSKFEFRLRSVQINELTGQLKLDSGNKAGLFQFNEQIVLVVDDAISNRELLTEALSAVGLTVHSAKDGFEAVEMAEKYRPELIIMDLRMPGKDGIQATKEIKAKLDIPVVALTASVNAMEEDYEEIFDGFLHKPVKLYDLFSESGRFLKFTLKDTGSQTNQEQEKVPAISFEQIINPEELAEKINRQIVSELEEFEGALSIDEVKNFAMLVKKLATEHSFNLLALEAEELHHSSSHYDAEKIEKSLKRIRTTLSKFLIFFQKAELPDKQESFISDSN